MDQCGLSSVSRMAAQAPCSGGTSAPPGQMLWVLSLPPPRGLPHFPVPPVRQDWNVTGSRGRDASPFIRQWHRDHLWSFWGVGGSPAPTGSSSSLPCPPPRARVLGGGHVFVCADWLHQVRFEARAGLGSVSESQGAAVPLPCFHLPALLAPCPGGCGIGRCRLPARLACPLPHQPPRRARRGSPLPRIRCSVSAHRCFKNLILSFRPGSPAASMATSSPELWGPSTSLVTGPGRCHHMSHWEPAGPQ